MWHSMYRLWHEMQWHTKGMRHHAAEVQVSVEQWAMGPCTPDRIRLHKGSFFAVVKPDFSAIISYSRPNCSVLIGMWSLTSMAVSYCVTPPPRFFFRKGSKGRAANGDRPVGAASCRQEQHTMASCQNPRFFDSPVGPPVQHRCTTLGAGGVGLEQLSLQCLLRQLCHEGSHTKIR